MDTMNTLKFWGVKAVTAFSAAGVIGAFSMVAHAAAIQRTGTIATGGVSDQATLGILFCNIIAAMFWILIVVSVIMILIAAFQYVLAGDDTEKTTKARKTLTYAAVGIAVALLATGFPSIIASVFGPSVNISVTSACAVL